MNKYAFKYDLEDSPNYQPTSPQSSQSPLSPQSPSITIRNPHTTTKYSFEYEMPSPITPPTTPLPFQTLSSLAHLRALIEAFIPQQHQWHQAFLALDPVIQHWGRAVLGQADFIDREIGTVLNRQVCFDDVERLGNMIDEVWQWVEYAVRDFDRVQEIAVERQLRESLERGSCSP